MRIEIRPFSPGVRRRGREGEREKKTGREGGREADDDGFVVAARIGEDADDDGDDDALYASDWYRCAMD